MSGFDFPPASDSSTPIGSLTRRFDGMRQTFQRENEAHPQRSTSSASRDPSSPRTSLSRLSQTRGLWTGHDHVQSHLRPRSELSASPSLSHSGDANVTERLRTVAAGTRAQIRRMRQEMSTTADSVGEELRDQQELLDRMGNHLDGILERINSARHTEEMLRTSTAQENELVDRNPEYGRLQRCHKRRRLNRVRESDTLEPYGYYGQNVPGHLKLEVADQNVSRLARNFKNLTYLKDNVLRNDESTYSSPTRPCKILFRHKGEVLFHLESLSIILPEKGDSNAVQQGLVYVGMSAASLASATAKTAIPSLSDAPIQTRSPTPQPSRSQEQLSLIEAMNDDVIWQASRRRDRHAHPPVDPPQRSVLSRELPPLNGLQLRGSLNYLGNEHENDEQDGDDDTTIAPNGGTSGLLDNCDWPGIDSNPSLALSALTRAPTPPRPQSTREPPLNVASSDDESAEDEPANHRSADEESADGRAEDTGDESDHIEGTRAASARMSAVPSGQFQRLRQMGRRRAREELQRLRDRQEQTTRAPEDFRYTQHGRPAEGERDTVEGDRGVVMYYRRGEEHETAHQEHSENEDAEQVDDEDDEIGANDTRDSGAESGPTPSARFLMPENERKITIRFHPPIAGKYILLKMSNLQPHVTASGYQDPSVDIKYVAAHGFCGPRFFPAVDMK